MDRVIEQTITWRYKGQTKDHVVRYFLATTDDHLARAQAVSATALAPEEIDAIAEYQRACEEGRAVIVDGPNRRKVE